MGCDSSKGVIPEGPYPPVGEGYPQPNPAGGVGVTQDNLFPARTPKSLAFEVPLHDNDDNNVIKKHPPKRFQRLEDQQMPQLTHRELDEKQAEAEQRRQQILNQRIQSAKARQKLKRSPGFNGETNGLLIESMHREPSTVEL